MELSPTLTKVGNIGHDLNHVSWIFRKCLNFWFRFHVGFAYMLLITNWGYWLCVSMFCSYIFDIYVSHIFKFMPS